MGVRFYLKIILLLNVVELNVHLIAHVSYITVNNTITKQSKYI